MPPTREEEEEEIPPKAATIQGLQQMYAQLLGNNAKMGKKEEEIFMQGMQQTLIRLLEENAKMQKRLDVMIKPSKQKLPEEPPALIELQAELPTLPPAKQVTKPAPQHSMEPVIPQPMELTPPTLPQPHPPASEQLIPKVARFAKEYRFRHRVVERIGFRSAVSPFASCSAFVRLGLYPAATLPFSSWTPNMVPCANQWEPSDHG